MLPVERRAALSLALIYMVRMLGLFIILPVFVLYADEFKYSTPFLMGLALGIYGLLQALLQIPIGMLSDKIGRKKTIAMGLLMLIAGSVTAALSDTIYGVIAGRALQGAGAITAALMALAADLSRDEQRTKMMAILGVSIGLSFFLALVIGPALITLFSIHSLFWVTAGLSVCALGLLVFAVPNPPPSQFHADTTANLARVKELATHPELRRLNLSIFFLHMIITATFVTVPIMLLDAGKAQDAHWEVYLPVMFLSLLVMLPMITLAERKKRMRLVMLSSVTGLLVTQLVFAWLPSTLNWLFFGILLFFCFLNTLEALLPSLMSRIAPAGARGTASGIYSSSQFLGAFVGGAGGGWILGLWGNTWLFLSLVLVCLLWLVVLWRFTAPRLLTSHRHRLSPAELAQGNAVLADLQQRAGVEEVVLSTDEGVAYMKVDKSVFKPVSG